MPYIAVVALMTSKLSADKKNQIKANLGQLKVNSKIANLDFVEFSLFY